MKLAKFFKSSLYILCCALLVVALFNVDNVRKDKSSNNESKSPTKVVFAHASWTYSYANLTELSEHSDIIALVKVIGISKEWYIENLPKTDFKVEIVEAIKNAETGDVINITQTGGPLNQNDKKTMLEIEDDPMFQPGEIFLIFAKKNDKGTYTILGGPQGRFKQIDGKLYAMKNVSDRVKHGKIEMSNELLGNIKNNIVNHND